MGVNKKKRMRMKDFEHREDMSKIIKKIFRYKIPETQLNELIHYQIQKFGTKINHKFINATYDRDGNVVLKKKR